MIVKKIASRMSPLCYLPNGNLISYKNGRLFVIKDGKILNSIPVFKSFKEKYLSNIKIIYRLLRLGVRSAIALSDNIIILSVANILYEFNLEKNTLSNGYDLQERIRPLYFTEVEGIDGFDDAIVFGGYLGNSEKKPVHIYKRVSLDNWEVVYTFPANIINHIHNIIPDIYRKCLWILTGDFGSSAAIWKVTNNFKNIECVLSDSQNYRACIGFTVPEGLLYATDTPFKQNSIYLMKEDYTVTSLAPIDGSCIFGCKWKDNYVFSSTVEADGKNQTKFELFFGRKRGLGIKSEYFSIYTGNVDDGFKSLYKMKKDLWPFIFKFGKFQFPAGINNSDCLYLQPVASKRNDLDLLRIKNNN